MRLSDGALPAATFLVSGDAIDVLRQPVEAAGGTIESLRVVHVQYRPGADIVVRYSARVSWSGAPATRETFAAATTTNGLLDGTVAVVAETPAGPLEVGVWRWPFDPILSGLGTAVTTRSVGELLHVDPETIEVAVVAYRPTERAVVAVSAGSDRLAYVKVVRPELAGPIAQRHHGLLAAGVPAPRVTRVDEALGVIVMEPLVGPTLRELIKTDAPGWPTAEAFDELADRFDAAEITTPGPASRVSDGALHAQMLARVAPSLSGRLLELADRFERWVPDSPGGVVHGDLHEGQVVVERSRIVGVLDIDDAGLGVAVDDRANMIARLRYRLIAPTVDDRASPHRLDQLASALRTSGISRHGAAAVDLHTAACLIGLATGPFRIQAEEWRTTVADLVAEAELLVRELS